MHLVTSIREFAIATVVKLNSVTPILINSSILISFQNFPTLNEV